MIDRRKKAIYTLKLKDFEEKKGIDPVKNFYLYSWIKCMIMIMSMLT